MKKINRCCLILCTSDIMKFRIGDRVVYCPVNHVGEEYLAISGSRGTVLDIIACDMIQIKVDNPPTPIPYNPFTCNPKNCKLIKEG